MVTAIARSSVTLSTGEQIAAEVVVVGIGARLAVALATQAGLTVDRGVVVDEFPQTSAADICVTGDIASFWRDGRRLALAAIGRDRDSLRAEVEFEQEPGA